MPNSHKKYDNPISLIQYFLGVQFIRFCIVGLFGSTINYLTYIFFLLWIDLEYAIAGVLGFIVPIPIVFVINRSWSFKAKVQVFKKLPIYFSTNLIALCGHSVVQIASHELVGVPQLYSQLIGIIASTGINYFLAKKLVFNFKREN